jgi:hypothetical protein
VMVSAAAAGRRRRTVVRDCVIMTGGRPGW